MIVDQAEKLRLMVRHTQRRARVLAVTSGKGGVGKTNIAANLALCLSASGKKVILVDADLGLANLDVILGMRARQTLAQVIEGKRRIDEIIERGPGGLGLICGVSGLTQLADLNEFQRQRLIQELSLLEHQADMIIVDTGAGLSRNVLSFCDAADHVLVVTTPEPTSLTDAYAVIKSLAVNHGGARISVLVNMVQNRSEAKRVFERLSQVAGRFLSIPIYDGGYVLQDPHVSQAVCQRQPVVLAYPRCQASACLMALAGKLGRGAWDQSGHEGFFRKVANWFF